MRLARACLRNFRCYEEETAVDFRDLTVLVGIQANVSQEPKTAARMLKALAMLGGMEDAYW